MKRVHKIAGAMALLVAMLSLGCVREKPEAPAAHDEPAAASDVSEATLPGSPDETASTTRAVAANTPSPAARTPALARPEIVLAEYLSDKAPDGSDASPTMGRMYHATFMAEARDAAWADYVEPRLRDYLERQRRITNVMPFSIACRATLCELLAVSRTPQSTPGEVDRWQDVIWKMPREQWYQSAQIKEPMVEFGTTADGRAAILTYLIRK